MPLLKTIIPKKNTKAYIWHITESLDNLNSVYLNESSRRRVFNMKSELHQRGFLSIRHLLDCAGYTDSDLYYSENGKPHLKDKKHISITHSFNYSAIIISDDEVGIDIEKNRPIIENIAHKFVGTESHFLRNDHLVEQLTVIWGAKESLYKIYSYPGLSFKKHIEVMPFMLNNRTTSAWIKSNDWDKKYQIIFEQFDGFTLVYAHSFIS
jgi:4'-phosphopantetheinyl transferase EntD